MALDYGISEAEYWSMTIGEFTRAIESKKKMLKLQAQEQASYHYILADLIGRSVARAFSSSNKMPDIGEVYPTLFDSEEIAQKKQEQMDKLSTIRFRLFADSHNKKIEEVQENK